MILLDGKIHSTEEREENWIPNGDGGKTTTFATHGATPKDFADFNLHVVN
jgi:hypothetical protein